MNVNLDVAINHRLNLSSEVQIEIMQKLEAIDWLEMMQTDCKKEEDAGKLDLKLNLKC